MTTIYEPRSCDCKFEVETQKPIQLCNLHKQRGRNTMDECKAHNLAWSAEPDEAKRERDLQREKEAIRRGDFSLRPPSRIIAAMKGSNKPWWKFW